ncbi:hypothetical protein BJP36_42060 [Moorena producens JHB]|uniref:Uncharacterized protein n=1 Tax=Moorena producens (strain JHB) TaxID=1454205 RepID=A0A9Q9UVK9_MOOP1|nr:hypothetical protein [Moorena producens]WAN68946.1 hypothetical protein BJP36_42060 [Moorena producens JHB]
MKHEGKHSAISLDLWPRYLRCYQRVAYQLLNKTGKLWPKATLRERLI